MSATALPDTSLVKEARALLEAAGERVLIDHSLRTFAFGRAWGRNQGRAFDDEDLCLAALFHDFGLTAKYRTTAEAFTVQSARELRRALEGRVEPQRLSAMAEAILFHMQLFPHFSRGNVVGLLQIGAWMDVMGLRSGSLRDTAAEIQQAFPTKLPLSTFNKLLLASLRSPRACLQLLRPPA